MAIFPESDRLDMDDVSGIAPEDVFVAPTPSAPLPFWLDDYAPMDSDTPSAYDEDEPDWDAINERMKARMME